MIDMSDPANQQALAQAAEKTGFRPEDLAAAVNIASPDDLRAIVDAYVLAWEAPDAPTALERFIAGLELLSQIAGYAVPGLGAANALKTLL